MEEEQQGALGRARGGCVVKYLAAATLFGMFGWLVGASVLDATGSDALAGLCFGCTVAVMVWGFDQRRRLDG